MLADPFVAPQQLIIEPKETGWTVGVLDDTNVVLLNGKPIEGAAMLLNSGDRITIGHTDLVVYSNDHPVEPTRKLPLSSWVGPGRVGPLVAICALVGICVLDGFLDYLQFSVDLEWDKYAYGSLFAAAFVVVWAGVWSMAGRVLRHQPYFWTQLSATLLVYVGLTIIYPLVGFAEFATGSVNTGKVATYLVAFLGLFALLKLNLFFATNIRRTYGAAFVVSCMVIGLTFAGMRFAEEDFKPEPIYSKVVRPPFAHISAEHSIDEFFDAAKSSVAW